jgi:hypothetical protein
MFSLLFPSLSFSFLFFPFLSFLSFLSFSFLLFPSLSFSFLLFLSLQSDAGSLKITGTIRTLSPLFSFHLSGHHILSSSSSSRSLLSSLFHSKPAASSFQLGNYHPSSFITGDNPDCGNHTIDITSFLRDGGQEHGGMTAVSEIILYDQHHQAFKKTVESLDFLSFLSSSSERNCLLDHYHPDNKHSSSSSSSSNDNSNRNSRSSAGSVGGSNHTSNGMKDMPFLTFSNCKIIQNPSCFHNVSCLILVSLFLLPHLFFFLLLLGFFSCASLSSIVFLFVSFSCF